MIKRAPTCVLAADAGSGQARFPGQAPIDAYGNGGFRFADMSHRGSLLLLPSGVYGWPVTAPGELTLDALTAALAERDQFLGAVEFEQRIGP